MNSLLTKATRPALIGLFALCTLAMVSGCDRRTPQTTDSGSTSGSSGAGTTSSNAPGGASSSALGSSGTIGTMGSSAGTPGTAGSPSSSSASGSAGGGAGSGESSDASGTSGTSNTASASSTSGTDSSTSGMGGAGSGNPSTATGSTGATTPGTGTGTAAMTTADRSFMETAARVNLAEVEASRLAADHASAQAVKAFAETMVRDHGSMGQQLRDLATRKGVALPTQPRATDIALMTRLRAARGAQFDRLYTEQVGVAAHKEAINLFEQAARNASDPDVKSFATGGVPALRSHLTMAQNLPNAAGNMGGAGSGDTTTGTPGTGNTDVTAPRPRQSRG